MSMLIPRRKKDIAPWAANLIHECTPDLEERIQRGALYRNLYLTGDENGNPATYPKTFEYIETLSSFLFSPLELRYALKFHGGGNPTHRAMGRAAAAELHEMMSDGGVYDACKEADKWSLVKGKCFIKLNWDRGGFAPFVVQPEFIGVLRPDLPTLDRQPAFVHTMYYTPSEFQNAFRELPNLGQIMKDIAKRGNRGRPDERPDRANALKQIVLGGLNPFQQAGNSPATASSRGIVNWLGGPQATWDPKIMAQLIRLDELWVQDVVTNDWATLQLVGDTLVTGGDVIRNAFADMYDPDNTMRRLPDAFRRDCPLSHMHPFVEFSSNQLDGYFWGRSEICNVGAMQMQINARLNGIARLLRRQENPPRFYTGSAAITQQKFSAGDKPGGWFVDPNPNAKQTNLYPELPQGLWDSLHELERMFEEMGGRSPVMRGRGESGVRSQGHADTLTENSAPRFLDRALAIERSVATIGYKGLALLQAMDNRTIVAWLKPGTKNAVALMVPDDPDLEPPADGMKQYPFRFLMLPENVKVQVAGHSASPILARMFRQLVFDLVKIGAITPEEAVELLHPEGESEITADFMERQIAQERLVQQHPELLAEMVGGRRGGRKK